MAVQFNHTPALAFDGRTLSASFSKTADGSVVLDPAIADGVTDSEIVGTVDVSQLKFLWISCDQVVTIETNNSGTPTDTFTLVANEPIIWWDTCKHANPLTADVTKWFVTNASGKTANVRIVYLQDVTL